MFYFVRHGETDYNVEKRTQGQSETKLTEKGIWQTKDVAKKLQNYDIDEIYCSPLSRTRITADEINKYHNLEIKYDDRLMERNAGSRQGKYYKDLTPEEKMLWRTNPERWGAESRLEFYNRCKEFFKTIEKSDKNILIVSHGGVWRNLRRYFDNEDLDFTKDLYYEVDNCEIDQLNKYMREHFSEWGL